MTGTYERALHDLAMTPAYSSGASFRAMATQWEETAETFDSSARKTGLEGVTADAAAVAFSRYADRSRKYAAAAVLVPGLLDEADGVRVRASAAVRVLPSSVVPAHIQVLAAQFGLATVVSNAFAARRESAAKVAVNSALNDFAALTPKLVNVGFVLDPATMQAAGAASNTTTDGQYRIGPPQQPTYSWDEDFIYGSQDSTFDDFLSSESWKTKLLGARALRWDLSDATGAYGHYWSNTGEPWAFDYEKAYRDDAGVRADIDRQIELAQNGADELAAGGNASFSFTGSPSATTHYPTTENWQKAIGGHQQWASGDVTVKNGVATMAVTVHGDDRYNFNQGQKDIASGSSDDENGRFTEIGWAKPFDSSGTVTRTVTWTIGDPASVSVSDASPSGR